ncbi:hypothetical protein MTP99_011316 [Tenebrio molitor]|nr:hypothetical protein MTP99_011316 [Tenebrio molitor]
MNVRSSVRNKQKSKTGPAKSEEPPPHPPPTTSVEKSKKIPEEAHRPSKMSPTTLQKSGESYRNPTNRPQSPQTSPASTPASSSLNSPASSSATKIPSTQSDPDAKYTIKNIPSNLATQKNFYNFLITTMGLKNIFTLIVNHNKSALLILPTALSDSFQKSLQTATNCPNITIAPINRKSPGHQPAPKKPTFSVVIRNISLDITPETSQPSAPHYQ